MEAVREGVAAREAATDARVDELACLSAHLSAATARWLELVLGMTEEEAASSGVPAWLSAWRCGITRREGREFMRVAEALQELPLIRAAFGRGELTFTKVRALTRVATASSEEGLLDLAGVLTASQLERALRAFRRAAADPTKRAELEYVDYYVDDDGTLFLRARLAAEDGTLLIKALEAARERVLERRREERAAAESDPQAPVKGMRSRAVGLLFRRVLCGSRRYSTSPKHRWRKPTSPVVRGRGLSSTSTRPLSVLMAGVAPSSRTAR